MEHSIKEKRQQDTDVIRKFSKAPHGGGAYERKLPKDTDVVRKFSKAPQGHGAYERKLPKYGLIT